MPEVCYQLKLKMDSLTIETDPFLCCKSVMDPKSELNQLCQKNHLPTPTYTCDRVGGEDHKPIFIATVHVNGRKYSGTQQPNAKEAEQKAAKRALRTKTFLPTPTAAAKSADMKPPSFQVAEGSVSNGDYEGTVLLVDLENVHNTTSYKGNIPMYKFAAKGHDLEHKADHVVPSRYKDGVDVAIIIHATRMIDLGYSVIVVSKDKIFLPLGDILGIKVITSLDELDQ